MGFDKSLPHWDDFQYGEKVGKGDLHWAHCKLCLAAKIIELKDEDAARTAQTGTPTASEDDIKKKGK